MASGAERLFMGVMAVCASALEMCPFPSFTHLKKWVVFVFSSEEFLLSRVLFMLWTQVPCQHLQMVVLILRVVFCLSFKNTLKMPPKRSLYS